MKFADYDCENRLTDVNDSSDDRVASYKYDYRGRRISKTIHDSQTTIHYCYDGDQIIADYNESGMLQRKYVYGPGIDEPICMIAGGNTYYYHFDGLGSVVALSNNSGQVVERYSYNVFGEPNRTSAVGNRYMFTGREYDSETGLYNYRARYYKPSIGRFLQTDPIPALNLYTYCGNNPINYIDPWGTDYWVQGFLWGHRSFCVGNPNGSYSSYGFYPSLENGWRDLFGGPRLIMGTDDDPGGNWKHKAPVQTSSEKDTEIKDMMDKLQDQYNSLPPEDRDEYWYGIYDCHSFANQMYDFANDNFGPDPSYDSIEVDISIPYP